ncbi:M23 family metallopeptidase [Candidatus Babeliales bacterium]|nr:M23 family metallopeptidase [Candidatus Babeliales bacterium]MCF7899611.1 M23 family metallopeptidase [Candidatus Babeliales bacterium]
MLHKLKFPLIVVFLSLILFWISFVIVKYYTYSDLPEVCLSGIEKKATYSGVVNCKMRADNGYKIANIDICIDGKDLCITDLKRINSKKFDIPFVLDTTKFSDGKHMLEINSVDSSYKKNKCKDNFEFFIDNMPLQAAFLDSEYKVSQGRTIHAKLQLNKNIKNTKIKFLENCYDCYPESDYSNVYECFIPIDCEVSPGEYILTAHLQDSVNGEVKLSTKAAIENVVFPKQRGFTVAKGKLEEEKEISMSNKILEEALEKWLKDSPKKKLWTGSFEVPLDCKKIATPFGEIRMTTEKGRYLHKAVDLLNLPRCVIWSAQAGRVIIKDRFLMSGNTVAIDHGLGVFTLYYHLEDFADIEIGDLIKKGSPIGKMGMTGYANGYHLHWELRVNNVPVDPLQWTKDTF